MADRVGLVLVSHSRSLAEGLAELAGQMVRGEVPVEPAGGLPDGGLGTDEEAVRAAIERARGDRGAAVLGDLGSAILTVRHILADGDYDDVALVDAPFVEGAVAAAVVASGGGSLDDVVKAAESARDVSKL
jgi:phosphoenolpyruvate---glycerone phosphotransferase subunit DhaM